MASFAFRIRIRIFSLGNSSEFLVHMFIVQSTALCKLFAVVLFPRSDRGKGSGHSMDDKAKNGCVAEDIGDGRVERGTGKEFGYDFAISLPNAPNTTFLMARYVFYVVVNANRSRSTEVAIEIWEIFYL